MRSENFYPLQSTWPQLYEYAAAAEQYVHADPHTAIVKLRCFVEALVGALYRDLHLPVALNANLFERMQTIDFVTVVPPVMMRRLHAIRMVGNKAAHGGEVDTHAAQALLREANFLGEWLVKSYGVQMAGDYPAFVLAAPFHAEETQQGKTALSELNDELARIEDAERAQTDSAPQQPDDAMLFRFTSAAANAASSIDSDTGTAQRLMQLPDAFAGDKLTSGQSELVALLDQFLSDSEHNVFLLKGYSGTGKTFITKGLTEYFRAVGRNYVLAAPTGKASKVIARKTRSPAYTVHKTIYSYKDLVEYRDDDLDGTETYKLYAQLAINSMSADTVFIVDEASMFSDVYQEAEFFRAGSGHLLSDFFKFVNLDHNDHRKKVIFIGDDAQLPPVGMPFSPALDAAYLSREYGVNTTSHELTEVVRQKADSGVMHNALQLRLALKAHTFNRLAIAFERPDVRRVEHADLVAAYLAACGNKINGESIVIAHSNSDVAAYNRRIRTHFFPDCAQIAAGDKVMATNNSSAYGFFISNGDFGLVREVLGLPEERRVTLKRKNADSGKVETIDIALTFRDIVVGFKDLDDRSCFFQAKIVENLLYSEHASLSSDENKALYLDFCIRHRELKSGTQEFKQALLSDPYFNALRLKFGYAITCHKAQGSEWNHVFVKCQTHQSQLSADYFRWLYTAMTRTASTLYLLDAPNLLPWSGTTVTVPPGMRMLSGSASVQPPVPPTRDGEQRITGGTAAATQDSFGIPEDELFLLGLLERVRSLIAGKQIAIDRIDHNQYQESYYFRRGDDHARVNVTYGNRGRVSTLLLPAPGAFSSELLHLLQPLKDAPIVASRGANRSQFNFDKPFLNEFHDYVETLATGAGIVIHDVVAQAWCQRYSFVRQSEIAVYDVWYDGRSRFTKCQPVIKACSAGNLVADVAQLLTKGLQR